MEADENGWARGFVHATVIMRGYKESRRPESRQGRGHLTIFVYIPTYIHLTQAVGWAGGRFFSLCTGAVETLKYIR